jgi:hypothetical protein
MQPKGPWELSPGFSLGWRYFYPLALVRAPDNAGAIPIDRTQIQMTISSAPSAAPTRHGGCFSPWALQSSAL